ncbi:hypothetical protein [Aquimarina sp. MMG016]|uniref:hypothetical protein n=1 Tax=Aquimarina sp. MMG016 TaxID=2822690 RepID=UPI001B3A1EA7|nr:hypothetical protein [Aquimarina sp. MMG016]MBQ4822501.1 hypothetical protein [Aquimarina sp. MMG016]
MKTLVLIIVSLILGLLSTKAQTSTTSSSKSSTRVSVSIDEDTEKESYYRTFAILDMDDDFRIKVRFMEYMQNDVKSYLVDQFGKENMTIDSGAYLWSKEIDDEELYEVKLKGNRLRINLDKELASEKQIKRFEQMGKELKSLTSKSDQQ